MCKNKDNDYYIKARNTGQLYITFIVLLDDITDSHNRNGNSDKKIDIHLSHWTLAHTHFEYIDNFVSICRNYAKTRSHQNVD